MVNGVIVVAVLGTLITFTQVLMLFVLSDFRGRIMRLESKQMQRVPAESGA